MTGQADTNNISTVMIGPLEGLPLPDLDNLPDYEQGFWEGAKAHELRLQQCAHCALFRHLPTPMCPNCHSLEYKWIKTSGRGKVYSYVIAHHPVHEALKEKKQTPYNIALIELEDQKGLRIVSNIINTPPEGISIDMSVEVTFMPCNDDRNIILPVFVPLDNTKE